MAFLATFLCVHSSPFSPPCAYSGVPRTFSPKRLLPPFRTKQLSFVPMSLEAFLPDFNLRKRYRQTGISLKRYQRRYALLTKILYTLEIMLASLYPCMSMLLMDVHSLLFWHPKLQNSKSKLISFSSWIPSLFWSWFPGTQALFFTLCDTFT